METISRLKKDLEFNKSLYSLVEVIKNIAVTQFRILEKQLKSFEKLTFFIKSFFGYVDTNKITHPFLRPQKKMQIVVAVTSDSGLLGGLNARVVNTALKELESIPGKLIIVGERGKVYAQEANVPFVGFSGIKEDQRFYQAIQMRDYALKKFFDESCGYLKVIYPRPLSLTVQHVETASFLPYIPSKEYTGTEKGIGDIIWESSPADIVEYLIYLWMGQRLYEIFGLSRLAEFGARFVHLEESSQKLKDLEKKIRLQYFRVRHELIDRNMREISAARLQYASRH